MRTITFILTFILFLAANPARAIILVRDGHAEAVIVVPADNRPTGADDLQRYVEKVSGAHLDIVPEDKLTEAKARARVYVGSGDAAKRVVDIKALQTEGFVIKTDGDDPPSSFLLFVPFVSSCSKTPPRRPVLPSHRRTVPSCGRVLRFL